MEYAFFLLGLLEINDSNFEDAFFYFEKAQKNGIKSANLYLNFFKHFDKYGKIHNSTSIAQEDNSQNENDAITELGNLQDDFSSNNEEHIILKSSVNLQAVETNDTPNSPSLDNKDQDEEDEIFDSEETNLRPWEKYADKQKKPALKKGESKIALEKTSIEAENSKLKKLQELVEKLQTKKLKKNKMKKYLSALLKLTPELAINRGEGVRTKFEFRNMVMPMHMQHNSAGNLVEGGRLKAIQNFVSNVVASTSTSPSN
jgi:hypothetical protein